MFPPHINFSISWVVQSQFTISIFQDASEERRLWECPQCTGLNEIDAESCRLSSRNRNFSFRSNSQKKKMLQLSWSAYWVTLDFHFSFCRECGGSCRGIIEESFISNVLTESVRLGEPFFSIRYRRKKRDLGVALDAHWGTTRPRLSAPSVGSRNLRTSASQGAWTFVIRLWSTPLFPPQESRWWWGLFRFGTILKPRVPFVQRPWGFMSSFISFSFLWKIFSVLFSWSCTSRYCEI